MAKLGLKTTVAAAAVAVPAAAFCPGTAQAIPYKFTKTVPMGKTVLGSKSSSTVKDKRFSNFACISAKPGCGAASYAPAPGGALGVVLMPGLKQMGMGSMNTTIGFTVSQTKGKALINDLKVTSDAAKKGSGLVSDVLMICAPSCTGKPGSVLVRTGLGGPKFGGTFSWKPPQKKIRVIDFMHVSATTKSGSASVTKVTKIVSEPEPASIALLGVGLLGLGLAHRRKAK